jgi:hypothetical protein
MTDNEIHTLPHESIMRGPRLGLIVDHAYIDDVDAHAGHLLADKCAVGHQAILETFELRPVGGEADAEESKLAVCL